MNEAGIDSSLVVSVSWLHMLTMEGFALGYVLASGDVLEPSCLGSE